MISKSQFTFKPHYKMNYKNIHDVIADEWDEKVINVAYLVKLVAIHIKEQMEEPNGFNLDQLEDVSISRECSPVAVIISSLEPDSINGTSERGVWFHSTIDQLAHINKALVQAYIDDHSSNLYR